MSGAVGNNSSLVKVATENGQVLVKYTSQSGQNTWTEKPEIYAKKVLDSANDMKARHGGLGIDNLRLDSRLILNDLNKQVTDSKVKSIVREARVAVNGEAVTRAEDAVQFITSLPSTLSGMGVKGVIRLPIKGAVMALQGLQTLLASKAPKSELRQAADKAREEAAGLHKEFERLLANIESTQLLPEAKPQYMAYTESVKTSSLAKEQEANAADERAALLETQGKLADMIKWLESL